MGHIALLSNPQAGKGRGRRMTDEAVAHLRGRGATVRVYSGVSATETRRLAVRALDEQPDVLVVVGGDGTLAGILEVLCAAGTPLTLVAAGTGNDLARALHLPRGDAAAAAELALTGMPRAIDVGEVRTRERRSLFLTVVALGFDARVSDRTNRLRWPAGALRYYLALLIELVRLRPLDYTVAVDGAAPTAAPGTLVAVGNTASYGGGMPVCPGAAPDDGRLDVVRVAPLGRVRLLALFPLLLRGRHLSRPEVTHARAQTVTVAAPGLVIYADGERLGEASCTVSVRPGALTVMTPSERTQDVR
ncbi:diacylglycerol kinase family protein [Microbacterium sp. p3-SID336]|uniref:diacylglycerol/lipid kinase family protein n=1 Tax=Microbacterium sp. p3-SID336 TaxID=2916212 RepID=UPI0021A967A1|nr:YegS/Rv2252/BmrU family lipid kinase [Microbacterium sp. p3-SID336]MCT1479068.1 YegS/Rv2252/BmrU family lipid kinase [Microbacterium sp. p3-SID336]